MTFLKYILPASFSLVISLLIFAPSINAYHGPPWCSGTIGGNCPAWCPDNGPWHPDWEVRCADAGESAHYCCEVEPPPPPEPPPEPPPPEPPPLPANCYSDSDCIDGNPCTVDYCLGSGSPGSLCINNPSSQGNVCQRDPNT